MISRAQSWFLVGLLITAGAIRWFVAGRYFEATEFRNAAVGVQMAFGIVLMAWAWRKRRSAMASS